MSDTPRTDAALGPGKSLTDLLDASKKLELELATAERKLKWIGALVKDYGQKGIDLEAQAVLLHRILAIVRGEGC